MALFNHDSYGKPISEELSNYLRTYTDKFDRADVAAETEIGTSTIRDVVFRTNSLTEQNSKAIIELMKIAVKKCELNIINSTEAKEELTEMLK
jgi:predicted DNA-binding protein YlxM (UPF0122 family)